LNLIRRNQFELKRTPRAEQADLKGADFTGADLTNASLENVKMDGVLLTNAVLNPKHSTLNPEH
jgi:uncharacterized protein YjbI with pentapeptide repeats